MSPESAEMLMGAIVPRLRSAIPRTVQPIGCEDSEELVQDAIATAAQMLHNVERAGKKVTPGNVAYFTILHMKSGRRSQNRSRADVMACGTQLDRRSSLLSTEEEVGWDAELDEPVHLGELLACKADDPSMAGARNLDWEEFLAARNLRYSAIVKATAEGERAGDLAKEQKITYAQLRWIMLNLQAEIMEHMGEEILEDAMRAPSWRSELRAKSERVACRHG